MAPPSSASHGLWADQPAAVSASMAQVAWLHATDGAKKCKISLDGKPYGGEYRFTADQIRLFSSTSRAEFEKTIAEIPAIGGAEKAPYYWEAIRKRQSDMAKKLTGGAPAVADGRLVYRGVADGGGGRLTTHAELERDYVWHGDPPHYTTPIAEHTKEHGDFHIHSTGWRHADQAAPSPGEVVQARATLRGAPMIPGLDDNDEA